LLVRGAVDVAGNVSIFGQTSKELESLAGSATVVTVRGELYKKAAGKKKADTSAPLKLLILEVQKKE